MCLGSGRKVWPGEGSPAGLGERGLLPFGEAAGQPSSRRVRTAKDCRRPKAIHQKPRGATHGGSASFPFLPIPSAELMSSGRLLSTATDSACVLLGGAGLCREGGSL